MNLNRYRAGIMNLSEMTHPALTPTGHDVAVVSGHAAQSRITCVCGYDTGWCESDRVAFAELVVHAGS